MSTIKRLIVALAGVVAMALGVQADTVWIGSDGGNFSTAGNWNNGAPSGTQIAWITNSGAVVNMTNASPAAMSHVYVQGSGTTPTLNISKNFSMATAASRSLSVGGGNASGLSGTVNHTAGTFTGQRIAIASSTNTATITGRSGTYNFSGGAISLSAASYIQVGSRPGETGYFNLSGTGSVAADQLGLGLFNGNATVKVEGGGLTLNFGQINMAGTYPGNGSTKIEAVLTGTGFSTINVATNVMFDIPTSNGTEFQLSLGSGYVHSNGTTYTIIDAAGDFTGYGRFGNVANNQVLTVDDNYFRANYITNTNAGEHDQFTLTAIPDVEAVTESFIYPAGTQLNTTAAGAGWSSGWKADSNLTTALDAAIDVTAGSITSPAFESRGLTGSGNRFEETETTNNSVVIYRGLSNGVDWALGSTTYYSVMAKWGGNQSTSASHLLFKLGDVNTYFGLSADGTNANRMRLTVRNTTAATQYGSALYGAGTNYMLVAKVVTASGSSGSNDTIYLSLFKPDDVLPGTEPIWDLSASAQRASGTVDVLSFDARTYSTNYSVAFDELRIGQTYNSVTYSPTYALTVNSGSGGGSYTNGHQVAITASNLFAKTFVEWIGDTQVLASAASIASNTVNMSTNAVSLTATYVDTTYDLTVNDGSGSGSAYTNGQQVGISATVIGGKTFVAWTGDTVYVTDSNSASTTVTMPAQAVSLTATYVDITYALTVTSGSGSGGSYTNGQQVAIEANAPASGYAFVEWTGDTQYVASASSASTTVTMPAQSVSLTATYVATTYALTVNSGNGGGLSYTNGQQVAIYADPPDSGKIFDKWIGDTQYLDNASSSIATVTMPAQAVNLTATYVDITYVLTVTSGTGGGSYTNGHVQSIAANAPAPGQAFSQWTGDTVYLADSNSSSTTVTMPAQAVSLTATYKDAAPQSTTNGTPYAWLDQYGLTNYVADAVLDQDNDGLLTWQEYIAGTDPTNSASCFKAAQATRNVITWIAQSNRIYSVYWSTNLVKGFANLQDNITLPQNSYTNTTPDGRVNHYQVKVRLP